MQRSASSLRAKGRNFARRIIASHDQRCLPSRLDPKHAFVLSKMPVFKTMPQPAMGGVKLLHAITGAYRFQVYILVCRQAPRLLLQLGIFAMQLNAMPRLLQHLPRLKGKPPTLRQCGQLLSLSSIFLGRHRSEKPLRKFWESPFT